MAPIVWVLLVPAVILGGIFAFGAAALAHDATAQAFTWLAVAAFALAAVGAWLTTRGARAGPWVLTVGTLLYLVAATGLLREVALAPTPAVEPPAQVPSRGDLLEGFAVQLGLPLLLMGLATTLAFRTRRPPRGAPGP